jgi:hypothetical protein
MVSIIYRFHSSKEARRNPPLYEAWSTYRAPRPPLSTFYEGSGSCPFTPFAYWKAF